MSSDISIFPKFLPLSKKVFATEDWDLVTGNRTLIWIRTITTSLLWYVYFRKWRHVIHGLKLCSVRLDKVSHRGVYGCILSVCGALPFEPKHYVHETLRPSTQSQQKLLEKSWGETAGCRCVLCCVVCVQRVFSLFVEPLPGCNKHAAIPFERNLQVRLKLRCVLNLWGHQIPKQLVCTVDPWKRWLVGLTMF